MIGIASFWSQFQDGLSASERVFALIDTEPKSHPDRLLIRYHGSRGEIEFRNLSFSYTEREQVLKDFNLNIPAGQNLALVGHTGAGKSSIARLIARFYEFQGGENSGGRTGHPPIRPGPVPKADRTCASGSFSFLRYGEGQHPLRALQADGRASREAADAHCRRKLARSPLQWTGHGGRAPAGPASPWDSGSWWLWPACC